MNPVSNVDRVALLVQQRLEERERLKRPRLRAREESSKAGQMVGIGNLAVLGDVDQKVLHRAFVQALLAEKFGRDMINDAQFQQVIQRVSEVIEADPDATRLISRVLSGIDLKSKR